MRSRMTRWWNFKIEIFTALSVVISLFVTRSCCQNETNITASDDFILDDESGDTLTLKWCGVSEKPPFTTIDIPESVTEEKTDFSVKLKRGWIKCDGGVSSSVFTLNLTRPLLYKSPFHESEFSTTGYFRVGDYYYPREGFCLTNVTLSNITVRVCGKFRKKPAEASPSWSYQECGANNPCLPKCCAMNKLYTITPGNGRRSCQDKYENSVNLKPVLYNWPSQQASDRKSVYYFRNRLRCKISSFVHESKILDPIYTVSKLCFRIRKDGVLLYRDMMEYSWGEIPVTNYCMDGTQFNGMAVNKSLEEFPGGEKHVGVLICFPEKKNETSVSRNFYNVLYGSASIIAAVFLLLTFVVYVLLWKEQKIQGWTTMSHSATMFFMYCFLASNQFLEMRARSIAPAYRSSLCMLSGIFTHFFFLSYFCWLTVICFSLFWTFRGINPSHPNSKNIGQYLLYATFGWGAPFAVVVVSVLLDQKYSYEPCNQFVVPEYGLVTCTVSPGALGIYIYYPIAVLLILNLIFFGITSYKLYQYKKSTSIARENLDENKQMFQLITKLFFVMGFTWIFEFVSWWHSGVERRWYWAIPDVINFLQAIVIFAIYVCKSNVSKSLKRNYPRLRPFLNICSKFEESLGFGGREPETTATHFASTTVDGRNKSFHLKSLRQKQFVVT